MNFRTRSGGFLLEDEAMKVECYPSSGCEGILRRKELG